MAGVDRVEAALTVTASLLSLVGTAFILICYLILPHKQHIRHALIVNLTLAGKSEGIRMAQRKEKC
jgi:hypothetical protein